MKRIIWTDEEKAKVVAAYVSNFTVWSRTDDTLYQLIDRSQQVLPAMRRRNAKYIAAATWFYPAVKKALDDRKPALKQAGSSPMSDGAMMKLDSLFRPITFPSANPFRQIAEQAMGPQPLDVAIDSLVQKILIHMAPSIKQLIRENVGVMDIQTVLNMQRGAQEPCGPSSGFGTGFGPFNAFGIPVGKQAPSSEQLPKPYSRQYGKLKKNVLLINLSPEQVRYVRQTYSNLLLLSFWKDKGESYEVLEGFIRMSDRIICSSGVRKATLAVLNKQAPNQCLFVENSNQALFVELERCVSR